MRLLIVLAIASCALCADVRVWQGTITLPTSEEGLPDPNPPFDLFATNRFNYPYTLRQNITDRRTNHAWRSVFLENEYLKCSVLPDIGGHLYTCVDKISGKPMFYANPSIKKAQIGYRGAWAAFGIEFNFPVSHNWVSMSPVPFAYAAHQDGSASVIVGNIDRVYGMEWSVEMTLRPGSTVLEERVTLRNRSDVRHRFYWWNNAAVEVWDDSQIAYPMRYVASHGFTEVRSWPIGPDGIDLSVIRNQTQGPVSWFVHGSREPFMGVWNPHSDTGTVHYASYPELPAKKIWSWGVDADGLDWRTALSDNNSAYVEVQAGLFRNQETYAFLEPEQTIRFNEYWMPVRETGGITRANLHGVLYLTRAGNGLHAALNANHSIRGAVIIVRSGPHELLHEQANLSPEHTWTRDIPLTQADTPCTLEVEDSNRVVLLHHTEGEFDWTPKDQIQTGPQSSYGPPPAERRSEDDWLQLGKSDELNGALLAALTVYRSGLKAFPDSFGLNKAAGRLSASLLRYEEAVQYLGKAAPRDTTDPEVSYYMGIAYQGRGETGKAQLAFEAAHRLPQFRAAGDLQLSELCARRGELREAERYLTDLLLTEPGDVRAEEELIAIRNALGAHGPAWTTGRDHSADNPLSLFLREELGQPDLETLAADPYRVLDVAAEYMRLGLYGRALTVVERRYPAVLADHSEPGSVLPQVHPLVGYYRAYCKQQLGTSAAAEYAAASKLSTLYVFPSTAEDLIVLSAAVAANSSDPTAQYLLGTLLFSRGLTAAALEHWNEARRASPSIPVLDADMGDALLRVQHDPAAAATVFEEGIATDSRNPLLYLGLDQALSLLKRSAEERVRALERYPDRARMPSELAYELALNRAEAGDFAGAIAVVENRFFAREEGGVNVRQVWVEVLLEKALSFERRGHCDSAMRIADGIANPVPGLAFTESGLTSMLDSARNQYLLGIIYDRCGQAANATRHFHNAMQRTGATEIVWAYAAAMKEGGNSAAWRQKIEAALARAQANSKSSSDASFWFYTTGILEQSLGDAHLADAAFSEALLLPDHMLAHHLSRVAREHDPGVPH